MRKIFTLDDLYEFYENRGENTTFSSKDTGYQLAVQIPASFDQMKDEYQDGTLLKCKVKICHSGLNRNKSSVTDEALEKAAKGLAYKPVLANFCDITDENGNTVKDFTSHDMIFNEDGTTTYLEHQVGCFTTDEPYMEVEKSTGHNFLYGYCVIPYEYTPAADIIARKNGTKVSVELAVNELQYKEKVLELTDVDITGVTLLGTNPETGEAVEEGMKNARLDICDFSKENNSVHYEADEKLIETLEKLNTTLSKLNTQHFEKGGSETVKLEEEIKDFEDEVVEVSTIEPIVEPETEAEPEVETEPEIVETADEDPEPEDAPEVEEPEEAPAEPIEPFSVEFKLSHDDIRVGLYNLLSAYESADNEYYCINAVYDDSFIYEGWMTGKIYGQKYSKSEDEAIVFDGERYELFADYLTASEKAELEAMRSNYAALVEFKETTEASELHSQKEKILADEKYSAISKKDSKGNYTNEAFAALMDKIDTYSVEEVEKEAKVILADCLVTKFDLESEKETPEVGKKNFIKVDKPKRTSRYGSIFKYTK